VLVDYPGCLVAVAYDLVGLWCLYNVRGFGGLCVQPRDTPLDKTTVHALARLSYSDVVHARTDRLEADIDTHESQVVVGTVPTDDLRGPLVCRRA
jgi:hypothetical protein